MYIVTKASPVYLFQLLTSGENETTFSKLRNTFLFLEGADLRDIKIENVEIEKIIKSDGFDSWVEKIQFTLFKSEPIAKVILEFSAFGGPIFVYIIPPDTNNVYKNDSKNEKIFNFFVKKICAKISVMYIRREYEKKQKEIERKNKLRAVSL